MHYVKYVQYEKDVMKSIKIESRRSDLWSRNAVLVSAYLVFQVLQ